MACMASSVSRHRMPWHPAQILEPVFPDQPPADSGGLPASTATNLSTRTSTGDRRSVWKVNKADSDVSCDLTQRSVNDQTRRRVFSLRLVLTHSRNMRVRRDIFQVLHRDVSPDPDIPVHTRDNVYTRHAELLPQTRCTSTLDLGYPTLHGDQTMQPSTPTKHQGNTWEGFRVRISSLRWNDATTNSSDFSATPNVYWQ